MREYSIRKSQLNGENYATMIITNSNGEHIAEYRLTPGCERSEIAAMRRAINKHLMDGGTMGNYQW